MRRTLFVCAMTLSMLGLTALNAEEAMKYPTTRRVDHVDDYHGSKVADPYRWLEDDVRTSKDVADWVAAQNKVTFAFLEKIPQRSAIRKRITELWNYERYSAPFKKGGRYFHSRNDGLQNQSVLYFSDTLDGKARMLLDPNKLSKDGTVALSGIEVSPDGKLLAYGLAESGSDWQTWKVKEIESGKVREDELKWIKYSSASWTKDAKGFFYSRFDEPKTGGKFISLTFNQKVFYHRLGTPQSDDVLVYRRPDHPWLLQTYVWQAYDLCPAFPELHRFLDFWRDSLEGDVHSVMVAHANMIKPAEFRAVDGVFRLH